MRSHKGISRQTDGGVSYSDSENAAGRCGRDIVGTLKFVDFPFKRPAVFFIVVIICYCFFMVHSSFFLCITRLGYDTVVRFLYRCMWSV